MRTRKGSGSGLGKGSVRITEVSPRDGLQNISLPIPTSTKVALIKRLHASGLRSIELTSLVSPRAVPQLADARDLLRDPAIRALFTSRTSSSTTFPVLVPNLKGLEDAAGLGVRDVAVFVSASEGFSRANVNCGVGEALRRAREVVSEARKRIGRDVWVRGYISCIFDDPFDGPTPASSVLHCVQELLSVGCNEISLGDTLGTGTPSQVRSLITYLSRHGVRLDLLAGHFHDTHGRAAQNVREAYRCGLRVFDSSVAGLGGCPFAPGAKGNVPTEELVRMFEKEGVDTGVDLGMLLETRSWVLGCLAELEGRKSRGEAADGSASLLEPPSGISGFNGSSLVARVGLRAADWGCIVRNILGIGERQPSA